MFGCFALSGRALRRNDLASGRMPDSCRAQGSRGHPLSRRSLKKHGVPETVTACVSLVVNPAVFDLDEAGVQHDKRPAVSPLLEVDLSRAHHVRAGPCVAWEKQNDIVRVPPLGVCFLGLPRVGRTSDLRLPLIFGVAIWEEVQFLVNHVGKRPVAGFACHAPDGGCFRRRGKIACDVAGFGIFNPVVLHFFGHLGISGITLRQAYSERMFIPWRFKESRRRNLKVAGGYCVCVRVGAAQELLG